MCGTVLSFQVAKICTIIAQVKSLMSAPNVNKVYVTRFTNKVYLIMDMDG